MAYVYLYGTRLCNSIALLVIGKMLRTLVLYLIYLYLLLGQKGLSLFAKFLAGTIKVDVCPKVTNVHAENRFVIFCVESHIHQLKYFIIFE